MLSRTFTRARAWAFIAAFLLPAGAYAATTYVTDQGHTEVLFGWSHAGVSIQTVFARSRRSMWGFSSSCLVSSSSKSLLALSA